MPHPDMVRLVVEHARDDRVLIGIRKRIARAVVDQLDPEDLARLSDLIQHDDERLCAFPKEMTALFLSLKDTAPAVSRLRTRYWAMLPSQSLQ